MAIWISSVYSISDSVTREYIVRGLLRDFAPICNEIFWCIRASDCIC